MRPGNKRILLLCNYYPGTAGAIMDHIFAFQKYSDNDYFVLSIFGDLPSWLDLSCFDALVFHYSLIASYDNYISPAGRQQIRNFKGFKAAFVQDDYRWINDTVNAFGYMEIHALFPLAGPEIMNQVYSPEKLPGVRKETVLAGYVPQELVGISVPAYSERALDVGYRARKLPAWMGSHTLQKWQIGEKFLSDAQVLNLKVDISWAEEDRIYGDNWIRFLTNCKATLGTESGASICDFTGDIQRNVEAYQKKYPEVDFDTLRELFFKNEDCKIMMNVISPRCFEAAALRTLMILYEGRYSGILIPWRHYVPLKRDHSNMDEVVRILRSPEQAERIICQAYEEIARNEKYSYKAMIMLVDRVMEEEWKSSLQPANNSYTHDEFDWLRQNTPCMLDRGTQILSDQWTYFDERKPSFDTALKSKNNLVTEISLKRSLAIQTIAIRWNTVSMMPPFKFKIKGLINGKIIKCWPNANLDGRAFQLIEVQPPSIAIDTIQICTSSDTKTNLVLAIIVKGTDPYIATRLIRKFNINLASYLVKIWSVMPEQFRRILRPVVRRIPGLSKR